MNKNIAEEFLPFFDKNLIEEFGVLPLEYTKDTLFVGITQEPEEKIKRALEELIPFKIKLYQISKDFFKKQVALLQKDPEEIIVFDKKRLIFPLAKDFLSNKSDPEDIIRFLIYKMIKEKKKFCLISENNIEKLNLPDFIPAKTRSFFTKSGIFNPLPIKVDKRKLLLYFELNKKGDIYIEILKGKFKEKSADELNTFFRNNDLIILGKDSYSLEFILYSFLKKQKNSKTAYLTNNKNLKFPNIETFYFSKKTFIKLLDILLKNDYATFIINGNIDLYPFMILGGKTRFIINLPIHSKEEFLEKIKKEKIEHAFKAKTNLKILNLDIIKTGQERVGGEKIIFFEIF